MPVPWSKVEEIYNRQSRNATIDLSVFKSLYEIQEDDGTSLADEVGALYLSIAPGLIQEIRLSLISGNAKGGFHAAHSLKSSSFNVGAKRLGEFCAQIESRSEGEERPQELLPILIEIELEYTSVKTDLKLILEAMKSG